jgi:hypothetical protein
MDIGYISLILNIDRGTTEIRLLIVQGQVCSEVPVFPALIAQAFVSMLAAEFWAAFIWTKDLLFPKR